MAAKKNVKGFEKNAERISRTQNVSMESARKILASGARKASKAAQKKNPRLLKVSGVKKK